MAVYTVHEPPLRRHEIEVDATRFVFVRDGFAFWAFVLGPLWMLRHRLWLALIIYLAMTVIGGIALHLAGVGPGGRLLALFAVALLIGFEASSLRRWTLGRRRWQNAGVVVADDLEAAERRFFDAWTRDRTLRSTQTSAPLRMGASAQPVIGLFPEPGARA